MYHVGFLSFVQSGTQGLFQDFVLCSWFLCRFEKSIVCSRFWQILRRFLSPHPELQFQDFLSPVCSLAFLSLRMLSSGPTMELALSFYGLLDCL